MKKRPWTIIIIAILHILAPIGNLVFNAVWNRVPFPMYIAMSFSWQNFSNHWIHFLAPVIAGLAIYACKKWSFYLYFLSMLILFYNSFVSYREVGNIMPLWALILVYVINILVVGYFLIPAVRAFYFDPRLRWWETKPRYFVDFEVKFFDISQTPELLHAIDQGERARPERDNNVKSIDDRDSDATPSDGIFFGHTTNFSETGLFIKSDFVPNDHDVIELLFDYDSKEYRFNGTVVLHQTQGKHGFGVQFLHSDLSAKSAHQLSKLMESKGVPINTLRIGPEDTFQYWARTLFKTGRGLVPNVRR